MSKHEAVPRTLKYEEWALLSERDILLLKALGIVMLSEVTHREPKQKVIPLPSYYLTITFNCNLCNSEYTRHFHMQTQKSGYLASIEVPELPEGVVAKTKKDRVSTCPHCRKELMCYDPDILVGKLMKLSNRLG